MNQNQKRIVIIEGDAFDADEITAIVKSAVKKEMRVWLRGVDESYDYEFEDEQTCHHAMAVAVDAWRAAVGDSAAAKLGGQHVQVLEPPS